MKTQTEAHRLSTAHHHELRDATAVSGAVVGSVLGMVGGPLGFAAGGVVGAIVGALSGVVLERETSRADARDRELDFETGVTDDDLDAHDIAAAVLTRAQEGAALERADADRALLALDAELGGIEPESPPPVGPALDAPAKIEPACPDCLDVRRESAGSIAWCRRHTGSHHRAQHVHYEYPESFAKGTMLLRFPQ